MAKWPKQKKAGILATFAGIVNSSGLVAAQTMLSMATKLAGSLCRIREVYKMKKRCKSCGEVKSSEYHDELLCGRCEKIQGDVMADLKAELLGT